MFWNYEYFLALVGFIYISVLVLTFLKELSRGISLYLLPVFFKRDLKIFGKWAVVTGGSAGIGKCTAIQLAKSGLNLVLVSNEFEELKTTSEDIKYEFGVECCYILADLTGGKAIYDSLWSKIEDKDIGIFINCAGIDGKSPCYFLEETERNILTMIALNMNTVIDTTYRLSNHYLKKKKGIIVNISSFSSFYPIPYYSAYSSCKRFVDFFTKAINSELSGTGVKLTSLTPFFINSRMLSDKPYLMKLGAFVPSCEIFCKSWPVSIGLSETYTGYWLHEVLAYGSRYFPTFMSNLCMHRLHSEAEKHRYESCKENNQRVY